MSIDSGGRICCEHRCIPSSLFVGRLLPDRQHSFLQMPQDHGRGRPGRKEIILREVNYEAVAAMGPGPATD